jgi:putative membrane protein insertion efficiency factor
MTLIEFPRVLAAWLYRLPRETLVLLIRGYKMTLSRVIGNRCRFQPSCSTYYIDALKKYGFICGSAKGIWRLCRCHPFNPGGFDPA